MKLRRKKIFKIIILTLLISFLPKVVLANSAKSAIVMEVKTGRILYGKNIFDKMPMASTTKIMTALIAIENGNLNNIVKISKEAVGIEGSSIYLKENEELLLEDLLYGLMLCSGNDAATAIANHISGSVEEFVRMMNRRAKEIGARNTNFTNPHGLHDKDHYTTAYDLALITRQALLNEKFKKIANTKRWVAKRQGYNYFYNKNKTLYQYEGGDGVKIGYTRAAGRCLVASATRNNMQLICVVLNDPNWFNDSYRLMDEAFDKYAPYTVFTKNKPVKSFFISKGNKERSFLTVQEDIIIPVSEKERNKIQIVFEGLKTFEAPIYKDQVLGKAKVYIGDKLILVTDLVAIENIEKQNLLDYLLDIFRK